MQRWFIIIMVLALTVMVGACADPALESEQDADSPGQSYWDETEEEVGYTDEEQEIIDFVDQNFKDVNACLTSIDKFMTALGDDGIEAFSDARTERFIDDVDTLTAIKAEWNTTPQNDELDDPEVRELEENFNLFLDETVATYTTFGEMLDAFMNSNLARSEKLAGECGAHWGMAEIARDGVRDVMRDL